MIFSTSKKHGRPFSPTEIIFCPTSKCNLSCKHCSVRNINLSIDLNAANKFISDAAKSGQIEKVGFSGGEPFLKIEDLCELIKTVVNENLFFGNLMTNGVWWKTSDELYKNLQKIYDAGFDGKICLSYDSFHGQEISCVHKFICAVNEIFKDKSSVEIWSVVNSNDVINDSKNFYINLCELAKNLGGTVEGNADKKTGCAEFLILNTETGLFIRAHRFSQSMNKSINSKKWFREDFCESVGNVLYVHANGKISCCCGFANENEELTIGNINDSFDTIIKNAGKNKMIELCYEKGLSSIIKNLSKEEKSKLRTNDACQFCDFVCKNIHKFTF